MSTSLRTIDRTLSTYKISYSWEIILVWQQVLNSKHCLGEQYACYCLSLLTVHTNHRIRISGCQMDLLLMQIFLVFEKRVRTSYVRFCGFEVNLLSQVNFYSFRSQVCVWILCWTWKRSTSWQFGYLIQFIVCIRGHRPWKTALRDFILKLTISNHNFSTNSLKKIDTTQKKCQNVESLHFSLMAINLRYSLCRELSLGIIRPW